MLRSATRSLSGRVLVAMLTGMGQDGSAGARRVVEAGGSVIAQDEATKRGLGHARCGRKRGLCHAVLPLPRIAQKLLDMLRGEPRMSQALSSATFETFATLLKNRSGLVIGPDKLYLLETRLAPILKREQLRDLAALAEKTKVTGERGG